MSSLDLHLGQHAHATFGPPLDALTRHVVCLGATGSGKTALCLALLEEVARHGIPVLALDPKGDVANLLLSFPDLAASDLAPWIDDRTLRTHHGDRAQAAAHEATRWREGLLRSGVELARLAALREAVDLAVFTPGSDAGQPLSILADLAPAPDASPEALRERAQTTAASLLALVDADASPRSRELGLLAALLQQAWQQGQRLDLATLVAQVQKPPFGQIGALDLETYYPAAERFELVLALNQLLVPGALRQGPPLSIDALLRSPGGKPRLSIVSIAHLSDAERSAFVTALLGQLVAWMRAQRGSSGLRAVLFLDEATGYLPPVAAPPTKAPLLTLFKQGRAQGLGVVVATQNPADLDYKALSNAGTWLIGRLATARDRQRVREALEGASLAGEDDLDATLASLQPRQFLCHAFWTPPVVFEARWTMSYLRGPLALDELRALSASSAAPHAASTDTPATSSPTATPPSALPRSSPALPSPPAPGSASALGLAASSPPLLPPGVKQLFAPSPRPEPPHYQPVALAVVRVGYRDRTHGLDETTTLTLTALLPEAPRELDWTDAERTSMDMEDLDSTPTPGATFAPPPAGSVTASAPRDWQRRLLAHLVQHEERTGFWSPQAQAASAPGEDERAFRQRLGALLAPRLDEAIGREQESREAKRQGFEQRLKRAEQALARQQERAAEAKTDAVLSAGAALLGGIFGGRGVAGKAVRTVKHLGRANHRGNEADRARQDVDDARAALTRFTQETHDAIEEMRAAWRPERAVLEPLRVHPAKGNIEVRFVGVGWWPTS